LLEIYRKMSLIRSFEEKIHESHEKGMLSFAKGFVHLYVGEEAVAVGTCANLRKDDYITSTHRGHGHCIAKGARLDKMMAEIFGKRTGYCQGRGGSMHIAVSEIGILGTNGIVGAGIPQAVGAGLSIKLRGTDQVAVAFFGDGASNTGAFHEGLNLAALWKLPVIFVCENNLYGISVHVSCSTSVQDIADRAKAYGIPGKVVDGMDVLAVFEAVREAVQRARRGLGPTLIECKTYRFRGHFEGEFWKPSYRTDEEIDQWKKKCPIARFKKKLFDMNALTQEEAEAIEREVASQVEAAFKFAMESPLPEPESALYGVFAQQQEVKEK